MKKGLVKFIFIFIFLIFLIYSHINSFTPGLDISKLFMISLKDMVGLIPAALFLISLFEVWVERKTVEKHLGKDSGLKAYIWIFLLASTTLGGLYIALPAGYALYKKGMSLELVFAYLSACSVCRLPMTIYEAVFMGPGFSLVRLCVSLPVIVITSKLAASYLEKRGYIIQE